MNERDWGSTVINADGEDAVTAKCEQARLIWGQWIATQDGSREERVAGARFDKHVAKCEKCTVAYMVFRLESA